MQIELEGIITRVNSVKGKYICSFTNGKNEYEVVLKEPIETGAVVKLKGEIEERFGKTQVRAESVEVLSNDEKKKIEKKISDSVEVKDVEMLVKDEVTEKLKKKILEIAKHLLVAKKMGRHILLRFHGDADGISGAMAITKFLKCYSIQQNSAVYSAKEAMKDLNMLSNQNKPIALFVDFGSNKESRVGLGFLQAAGIEIVMIDHHPYDKEDEPMADFFINPWMISDNEKLSEYTAGYLCTEIARSAGVEGIENIAGNALAGDRSEILELKDENRETALVLDFMATYSSYGNNLDFYQNVLMKKELYTSMLSQAKEKIRSISEGVKKSMKERKVGEFSVYVLDLERMAGEYEFPSKGKVANAVLDTIDKNKAIVMIGYGKRIIILRLNSVAVEKGAKGNELIEKVKKSMDAFIWSGGGHAKAAALKVRDGFAKDVAEGIVRELESL